MMISTLLPPPKLALFTNFHGDGANYLVFYYFNDSRSSTICVEINYQTNRG